jgi:hypothetical protein
MTLVEGLGRLVPRWGRPRRRGRLKGRRRRRSRTRPGGLVCRRGRGGWRRRIGGTSACATQCIARALKSRRHARSLAAALGGLGFDLSNRLFQRQPLAGDFGFAQGRLHAAQLGDQSGTRTLVERAPALAGRTGIQSGDGASDQRVIVGHINSTVHASR